jgi:hypothetical protein
MRVKAKAFRSYIHILECLGKREAVVAAVPPATAKLMADPPLPGSWMDEHHMHHIIEAVEKIGGLVAVRELARRGTEEAREPYMNLVEGVLKLFGTSPATLFKRMNLLVSSLLEGIDYTYTSTGERSGFMDMQWSASYEIPTCVFVAQIPTFQTLLDACGVHGVVGTPERLGPQRARFPIQW